MPSPTTRLSCLSRPLCTRHGHPTHVLVMAVAATTTSNKRHQLSHGCPSSLLQAHGDHHIRHSVEGIRKSTRMRIIFLPSFRPSCHRRAPTTMPSKPRTAKPHTAKPQSPHRMSARLAAASTATRARMTSAMTTIAATSTTAIAHATRQPATKKQRVRLVHASAAELAQVARVPPCAGAVPATSRKFLGAHVSAAGGRLLAAKEITEMPSHSAYYTWRVSCTHLPCHWQAFNAPSPMPTPSTPTLSPSSSNHAPGPTRHSIRPSPVHLPRRIA